MVLEVHFGSACTTAVRSRMDKRALPAPDCSGSDAICGEYFCSTGSDSTATESNSEAGADGRCADDEAFDAASSAATAAPAFERRILRRVRETRRDDIQSNCK